jgi:hypothetical protein
MKTPSSAFCDRREKSKNPQKDQFAHIGFLGLHHRFRTEGVGLPGVPDLLPG